MQIFIREKDFFLWSDIKNELYYHVAMTVDPRKLPDYSFSEEINNSISHLIGFVFGLAVSFLFIYLEVIYPSLRFKMYPFYIYTFFMMVMFFNSGFYHSRKFNSKSRAVTRVIDHCDIYLFVAATYTPICIYGITNQTISITLLILEWVLSIAGVIITLIDMNHKVLKYIAFFIYIVTGWAIMFFYPFNIGISFNVFLFVLLGGISYTVGAIMFAIGSKKRWFHTIFHYFVLAGAVLQFAGIYFLALEQI